MIKQLTVCVCDLCGEAKPATIHMTSYNEYYFDLPEGWTASQYNRNVHVCPECNHKLQYGRGRGQA